MTELYANPYNPAAKGFYFISYEEYLSKSSTIVDSLGLPVEEFDIEFIDGDLPQLFSVCGIDQATLKLWFEEIESMSDQVYYSVKNDFVLFYNYALLLFNSSNNWQFSAR